MTKYDVTLTIPVRIYGERQLPGTVVEVDDALLEELQKHNAVVNVQEKDNVGDDQQDDGKDDNSDEDLDATDANGDGYLTIDEIKAELDKREVSYKGIRKREELLALLNEPQEGE